MKTRLFVIVFVALSLVVVAVALAAPTCAQPYCIRHDNAASHNVGVSGTLFDSRITGRAGYWLVWIDTDGQQTAVTVTGYNIQSAWLPARADMANLVPNPDRLPDPSNYTVVATPGANIVITAKSGNLPREFLLGIHGLDGTLWGVLGSVSALPTLVPTATPLATVTPVPTATPLPTLAPPPTATALPALSTPAPTPTP